MNSNNIAYYYSSVKPDEEQWEKLNNFLINKYNTTLILEFVEDTSIKSGFILKVFDDVYDRTEKAVLNKILDNISLTGTDYENIIPLFEGNINSFAFDKGAKKIGRVTSTGDGIAKISGLSDVFYGEILQFECGARGMVQNLNENEAGCILFDSGDNVTQGQAVYTTKKVAGVPVGNEFLGRVINPLGEPIDDLGVIHADAYRPIETPAPSIMERSPVKHPMETGILTIDSMFPIGKGQRELIIGDRQTGKTAIAIDSIINQKGKNVICIYVAIGQKASSVAAIWNTLKSHGADKYTTIICADAACGSSLQYIAPYSGCALGEYFMYNGKDVLIVYDDLSKHAVAYRTLSLLLGRSPGREAYPGDVFYLHSRLLERSAQLKEALGGGSMTALPIVETQAGDISAYIPTNVISITDGQIFLEEELFFSGQRPAVNVGLSVSRVGSSAQTTAMKKSVGALRLDLSAYREKEIFTKFASELDDVTVQSLKYGKSLLYALRQKQYAPYKQHQQVIMLIAARNRMLMDLNANKIPHFCEELLKTMYKNYSELCDSVDKTGTLSEEFDKIICDTATELLKKYG